MKKIHFNSRITLIIFSLILFSCNSSKKVVSQEADPENYFIIGTGGGFTGLYTQYKIHDSGLIEIYDFENETYGSYVTADKNQVDDFFDQMVKLDLLHIDYSTPGNISDYIEVPGSDQTLNRIVWANSTSNFNSEVIQFYESVMQFIKDQKKT